MIDFNQFINKNLNEAFKFTEEQILDVANLIADAISKLDKVSAEVHDLEFDKSRGAGFEISIDGVKHEGGSYTVRPNGEVVNDAIGISFPNAIYAKIGDTDVKKVMKNVQQFESTFNESEEPIFEMYLEGIKSLADELNAEIYKATLKNGVKSATIKATTTTKTWDDGSPVLKYLARGKAQSTAFTLYQRPFTVLHDVAHGWFYFTDGRKWFGLHMSDGYYDPSDLPFDMKVVNSVEESVSTDSVEAIEDLNERSINKIQKDWAKVTADMAVLAKQYSAAEGDAKAKILATLKELTATKKSLERELDDAVSGKDRDVQLAIKESKVTLKRRYTENYPAITAGKHAHIRNKMLEAIKDGQITQEEFDNILKELSSDSKRWMRTNSKYFNVSEKGISLSKFGKRALQSITVNEEQPETNDRPLEIKVNENRDPKSIRKEYDDLKKVSVQDLRNMWSRTYRIGNPKELDKEGLIMDILVAKHGAKYIDAAFEALTEKTTENPEVWVPGAFDKELSKMPNSKITYDIVKDLAKKHKVFLDDAIAYVEYGWDLDLQENIKTNMKTNFIYESFQEFVENKLNESTLNEAFASLKLASILTGANAMDKDLPKAFYNMAKISLDKIQDVDIIEMDPATARKEKRANAVYLYFTTNEKENPYAGRSSWGQERTIPANTLLAITDGSNEWMATEWQKSYSRDKKATRTLKTTSRDNSAGLQKSGARSEYGSGISSMKQVVELADRAYCLDLDILKARYSTAAIRDARSAAKAGAIAFQNDKEFKQENLNRYNSIIANRAVQMPIDKMVADAIDSISAQIKNAMLKGEKGQYGDIIVGKTDKGREAKMSDAANHMQRILDDFQRYVSYTNQAEEEKKAGYGGDFYTREVKKFAKSITDRIKQIDNFSYAW